MEGVWGLLGLPTPAYVSSRYNSSGSCESEGGVAQISTVALGGDNVVGHAGHIDDSLSSLLHEDNTLWMLRTMFECLEMTPNGSLFLTPPHKLPRRAANLVADDERVLRARVNQQISQAVEDERRAREAQSDVLALFGTTGLHEENILRAMEEDQRKARKKVIRQRRLQMVTRFKDDLHRRIAAAGQTFDDGMAQDLDILDRAFADDEGDSEQTHATDEETIDIGAAKAGERGGEGQTEESDGLEDKAETERAVAPASIVQEEGDEEKDVSVKGAEGPESEDDEVQAGAGACERKQTAREAKGKERVYEWEAAIEAALRAAHRGDFDESKVVREHERRRKRFGSELAQQMRNLEHKTDEMRRELASVKGYAPFCPSCFRPVVAPCLCRLDSDSSSGVPSSSLTAPTAP